MIKNIILLFLNRLSRQGRLRRLIAAQREIKRPLGFGNRVPVEVAFDREAGGAFDFRPFLLISLTFYFEQVMFLAMGFCIGALAPRIRSPLPVALSTVFGFFVIGMAAAALDRPELYYLAPFKYFDTLNILMRLAYRPSFVLAACVLTGGCVLAAYAGFLRRDLRA